MLRTQLRALAIASLALNVGFASGSALAQDAGSADAGSPGDLGGTTLFQATVGAPGLISGTALAPTDPNAPGAQSGTPRRQVDADALAELLRGDNGLSFAPGRNLQDFVQHLAQRQQALDNARRVGQTQFGGATRSQTNVDAPPGGATPAQTGANSGTALFRGDNGLGLALGHNPQGFTQQQSSNGRGVGQTERATTDNLNGRRLGQLRRSVDATIADQVVSAKSALVANTIADQVVSARNALVANAIETSNVDSAATFPDTSAGSLNDGSPDVVVLAATADNGPRVGHTQLAASDDSKGKRLGQLRRSEDGTIADPGSAATFPGTSPVSLSDGSPEVLAAAPSPVPEPASWLLLALGLMVLAGRALMRRGTLLR